MNPAFFRLSLQTSAGALDFDIDVSGFAAGRHSYGALLEGASTMDVAGVPVVVPSLSNLIRIRQAAMANSPVDLTWRQSETAQMLRVTEEVLGIDEGIEPVGGPRGL